MSNLSSTDHRWFSIPRMPPINICEVCGKFRDWMALEDGECSGVWEPDR
jgi:hypothetical protein